jgi:glycosyltransferase involved in cell wall biosynthesis
MRIAIVSLQFEETATGGGGVHVAQITRQLLALGHQVTIVSIHTNKTLREEPTEHNAEAAFSVEPLGDLTVVRFLIDRDIDQPYVGDKETELERIMRFAEAAISWLRANQDLFDVVCLQGHHTLPGYMARELRDIRPKRFSYLHALETTYVTKKGQFIGAYEGTKEILSRIRRLEAMSRYADRIIANSPLVRDDFVQIVSEYDDVAMLDGRVEVLASGCDASFLMADEEVRAKLGRFPERIELITFCRIDPSKGIEYAIAGAVEAARLSERPLRLTVVGIPASEAYVEKLRRAAKSAPANLQIEITLMERISPPVEKRAILDDKQIYILPTLKEPFGMSLIEASARGNMIVSADTNGPHFILGAEHGEDTGWGIATERGVLARITAEPERNLAHNIGQAVAWTVDRWRDGPRRVIALNDKIRSTWTWEGIAKRYIELFQSV